MALFLDGPAVTIDDLLAEDSGLLVTAQTVGINVTAKLTLAMSEVQSELETLLLRLQSAATIGLVQPPGIGQVVATTDLARWEKMQALAMVYRDASFTQLIDRYKSKWDVFATLTIAAKNQFIANGIGLVNDPVPEAALPVLGTTSVTTTTESRGGNVLRVRHLGECGRAGRVSIRSSLARGSRAERDDGDGNGSAVECGGIQRLRGNGSRDDDAAKHDRGGSSGRGVYVPSRRFRQFAASGNRTDSGLREGSCMRKTTMSEGLIPVNSRD